MAIFGIYAKFASQRNGPCLKGGLVDPVCGQKQIARKSQKSETVKTAQKTLVSEALVAIFRIYAKFALQRNGRCLKGTILDPFGDQKEVTKKVPKEQNLLNKSKPLVSEPLVAIFRIYAKFALQRNGRCLKQTILDQEESTPKCKTFKTSQNILFQSLSWPFSESTRNWLHNAMVVVSNEPFWTPFVTERGSRKKITQVEFG